MSEWSEWKLPDQVPLTSLDAAGAAPAHTAAITNSSEIWDKSLVRIMAFLHLQFGLGESKAKNFGLELLVPHLTLKSDEIPVL